MQIECLFAIAFATASLAQPQEENDVPDSFVLFEHFPEVVAISDSDNDTIFECMAGKRISFDKENKRVKFMWFFNDPTNNSTVTFYFEQGSSPDTFLYTEASADTLPEVGRFVYTNYKNCGISDMPYHGRQCILWVPKGQMDELPEECLKRFSEYCGVETPSHSEDLCNN